MERKIIYITLLAVLWSCSRIDDNSDRFIGLSAGVADMEVSTRSAVTGTPYSGSAPSETNPLNAAVWFSTTSGNFIHEPVFPAYLPCRTTMKFEGESVTYADYDENPTDNDPAISLKYPNNNDPVYCIGLHPASGWNSDDGVKISHPITGAEDLMFADQITGTWNSHFPKQQYSHLLTWIKINFCAMTMEAARQWGGVTEITISSKDKLEIDLAETGDKISYIGNDIEIKTFEKAEGLLPSLTSTEAGSVLCSPATEYIVKIKTTNYPGGKDIPISLTNLDYQPLTSSSEAVGKLFIISLYFSPFNVIEGTCTLNYWNDQNEDLYMK